MDFPSGIDDLTLDFLRDDGQLGDRFGVFGDGLEAAFEIVGMHAQASEVMLNGAGAIVEPAQVLGVQPEATVAFAQGAPFLQHGQQHGQAVGELAECAFGFLGRGG